MKTTANLVLICLVINFLIPITAGAQDLQTLTAPNGFTIQITQDHSTTQLNASVHISSPWGEQMDFQITTQTLDEKKGKQQLTTVIDGTTTLVYQVEPHNGDQQVTQMSIVRGEDSVSAHAVPVTAGASYVPTATQTAFQQLLTQALTQGHSPEFYSQMSAAIASVQSGVLGCLLGITGYIASFSGFLLCVTLVGCIPAILVHYLAIASAVCSCVPHLC